MKPVKKLITGSLLFASIIISLTQCKSPASQQPDTVVSKPMDTATALDTIKGDTSTVSEVVKSRAPLTLVITNLVSRTAPVIVGLYDEKCKFPDPKGQLKIYTFKPDSVTLTATIADLPFGTYALAIYQDVNSNGKIDKNLIGIPTEPYAFSNNYKPTVKAPGFKNCSFEYSASANSVSMTMIK
jgi:uncharacterized protein (DUF2141 family)